MSVDKFGRFSKRGLVGRPGPPGPQGASGPQGKQGERGPQGTGFSLTQDDHYDLNSKRVKRLAAPVDDSDATTKIYVDDKISSLNKELRESINKVIQDMTLYINNEVEKVENYIFSHIIKKKEMVPKDNDDGVYE